MSKLCLCTRVVSFKRAQEQNAVSRSEVCGADVISHKFCLCNMAFTCVAWRGWKGGGGRGPGRAEKPTKTRPMLTRVRTRAVCFFTKHI